MNQKTTKFNQDAFVEADNLPGNVSQALSNEISTSGMRTESLNITSYTAGDTSGKPDKGLPEVAEASTPKRIARKYLPIQSTTKSQDAVFPQDNSDIEFMWRPRGFQQDSFVSAKDSKNTILTPEKQEKGGPSREVMGLLKQLGHSDANETVKESRMGITNNIIQEKSITVNLSPTNVHNLEFNNYISAKSGDSNIRNDHYHLQSDTVIKSSVVFANKERTQRQHNTDATDKPQKNEKTHLVEFDTAKSLRATTADNSVSRNQQIHNDITELSGQIIHDGTINGLETTSQEKPSGETDKSVLQTYKEVPISTAQGPQNQETSVGLATEEQLTIHAEHIYEADKSTRELAINTTSIDAVNETKSDIQERSIDAVNETKSDIQERSIDVVNETKSGIQERSIDATNETKSGIQERSIDAVNETKSGIQERSIDTTNETRHEYMNSNSNSGIPQTPNVQSHSLKTQEFSIQPKQTSSHVFQDTDSKLTNLNTSDSNIETDAFVYEQVRTILGEDKQDWKQILKTVKSNIQAQQSPHTAQSNTHVASQEVQIEQIIHEVLQQEANNRAELEHVLTHKFSGELNNMQQSMNKKIQELLEAFQGFMMR